MAERELPVGRLLRLPEAYPNLVTEQQVQDFIRDLRGNLASLGQFVVSYSLARIPSVFYWVVFIVLVPVLVFFILKDKVLLVRWVSNLLPHNRPLMMQIWKEMDMQMANYIRGKVLEIIIVGVVSYVCFAVLKLNYAALLAVIVGLSVLVPYIGATVATLPIAMVGLFQWGLGNEFMVLMAVYAVIQALDGNVLVPILFSEAVNLHPVAIIAAVLIFGGLWGFWGVFFAIPLATLFKAVLYAWPRGVEADIEVPPIEEPVRNQ